MPADPHDDAVLGADEALDAVDVAFAKDQWTEGKFRKVVAWFALQRALRDSTPPSSRLA